MAMLVGLDYARTGNTFQFVLSLRLGVIDLSLDRPERPIRDAAAIGQSHDPEPLQDSFWHAYCQTLISFERAFHDFNSSQIDADL